MHMSNIDEKAFKAQKVNEWMSYWNLNEAQAELVYDKAYQDHHSSWCDMVNCCDEYADFAEEILKLANKDN